ncbi:MAG: hypothetical protein ACI3YZ_08870 [Prevotella sp.]
MEENKKKALDESQLDEVAGGVNWAGMRGCKECGKEAAKEIHY